MASAKKTFAPKSFASATFAGGNWRGVGVDVSTININHETLEWQALPQRLHYTSRDNPLHYNALPSHLHYQADEKS